MKGMKKMFWDFGQVPHEKSIFFIRAQICKIELNPNHRCDTMACECATKNMTLKNAQKGIWDQVFLKEMGWDA